MSSEDALSDMAQKTVQFDLKESLLVIAGIDPSVFSIDCSNPKLSLKQLYDALFVDIREPTEMIVNATGLVDSDPRARSFYTSVKKVIEEAVSEINSKLPAVIAARQKLEKTLAESMTAGAE